MRVGYFKGGNSSTSHANDWSANPPNSTPLTIETPPTTARSRIGRPLSIWKSGVDADPRYAPLSAPAKPAMAADSANTASLVPNRLTPSVADAAGLSRIAIKRRP